MASDDDFTFCQVGLPADLDDPKEHRMLLDMSSISVKDESAVGTGYNETSGNPWKNKFSSDGVVKKEASVGSLSFNVFDTSSRLKLTELPKQAESSVSDSHQPKGPVRNSAPRAKVPFEKGYSQMDWLKLTRTHPDLAGLNGKSNRRLISMDEVKQHQSGGAMWTVLKGRVYNIAPYMKFHPGGVDMLMKAVGKDCTSLFNKYHAWVNAEALLEKCFVGNVESR